VQSPETLLAIRLVFGPIPAIIFILGIIIVQKYPLDEIKYNAILAEAEEHKQIS